LGPEKIGLIVGEKGEKWGKKPVLKGWKNRD